MNHCSLSNRNALNLSNRRPPIISSPSLDKNSSDWRHYDGVHCVFRPKQMPPEVLEAERHWAWHAYYRLPSIARRILKPGDKLLEIATIMYFNWVYRPGYLSTVTPKAVWVLLKGTRQTFGQRRVQLILQGVDDPVST